MLSLFYRLSIIESQLGICISDVESEEVTENWSSSSSVFGSTDEAQEVPVSISNSAGGGNASGGGQRDKGEINDAFVGRVCTGWSVGQGPAKLFENRGDVVLRLVEGRP